jgi:hypothetical protein
MVAIMVDATARSWMISSAVYSEGVKVRTTKPTMCFLSVRAYRVQYEMIWTMTMPRSILSMTALLDQLRLDGTAQKNRTYLAKNPINLSPIACLRATCTRVDIERYALKVY